MNIVGQLHARVGRPVLEAFAGEDLIYSVAGQAPVRVRGIWSVAGDMEELDDAGRKRTRIASVSISRDQHRGVPEPRLDARIERPATGELWRVRSILAQTEASSQVELVFVSRIEQARKGSRAPRPSGK